MANALYKSAVSLLLVVLLVGTIVSGTYQDGEDTGDLGHVLDLYEDSVGSNGGPPQIMAPEKRYLCPKYYIYNPVRARCLPTIMALKTMRTMRAKAPRSFPNPQAWAHM